MTNTEPNKKWPPFLPSQTDPSSQVLPGVRRRPLKYDDQAGFKDAELCFHLSETSITNTLLLIIANFCFIVLGFGSFVLEIKKSAMSTAV